MFKKLISSQKRTEYTFGNWKIILHSANEINHPEIQSSFLGIDTESQSQFFPSLSVNVWYTAPSTEWESEFSKLKENATTFTPYGLLSFYNAMDAAGVPHLPLANHCNRYYSFQKYVLVEFPYETDEFKIVCDTETQRLFLSGPFSSINRILNDCISVLSETLPIHGCAIARDNQATCILGDSGSGKTFLLLLMLKAGALYIADDELFVSNGKVYSLSELVQIRGGFIDFPLSSDAKQGENKKFFVSAKKLFNGVCKEAFVKEYYIISSKSTPSYLQWFPCVARQSYWWLVFLNDCDIDPIKILNKLIRSQSIVKNILDKTEIKRICFEKIEEYYQTVNTSNIEVILKEVLQ